MTTKLVNGIENGDILTEQKIKKSKSDISIGDRFGKWTVLNIDKNNYKSGYKVFCKCDCGKTEKYVSRTDLINEKSKGCIKCSYRKEQYDTPISKIFVGQKYSKWTVLNIDKNNSKKGYQVFCKCDCGRIEKYVGGKDLINGKSTKCQKCSYETLSFTKRNTHEEYLEKLVKLGTKIKVKEGCYYEKGDENLTHICPRCNHEWEATPFNILKGQTMCLKCSNEIKESEMATVLKQVFKHELPDTEWEHDLGFKGKGGHTSPYDIYSPSFNLVIECQSAYHDVEEQMKHDYKKKLYVVEELDLNYIALDHRDYTPLQAIQLFFPNIKEIPAYVDINKDTRRKWSIEEAQKLLNSHLTFQEIADKLNVKIGVIYTNVRNKKLIKPTGYTTLTERCWILDEVQALLNEEKYTYEEIAKMQGNGCTRKAIGSAVRRGELINPNSNASKEKLKKEVMQINLDGKRIIEHKGVKSLEGFDGSSIIKACKGKYSTKGHEYKGFLWYYKSDYENMINKKEV